MIKNLSPILVVGSHRSGSTWVGKMLVWPRSIAYVSEPFNPKTGLRIFKHWFEYIHEGNEEKYLAAIDQLMRFRGRYHLNLPAIKYWSNNFYLNRRPLIKDPLASFSAPWLAQRFGCQVVVLVRHPAAFYASLKRLNWRFDFNNFLSQKDLMVNYLSPLAGLFKKPNKSFAEEAAILWLAINQVLSQLIDLHPEWLVKRYEDLAARPLAEFSDLYQRLGLMLTPSIKKKILAYSDKSHPSIITDQRQLVLKRASGEMVKNWQKNLTVEEIKIIHSITAPIADRFYAAADWQ